MKEGPRNWAGNFTFHAARVHRPDNVGQVRELVDAAARAKALGSRHSFHGIADTGGDLISLERLNRIVALDCDRRTVTVEGGIRYGELCAALHRAGFALRNLASLPHISVAGACATATHGSGDGNGGLATAVAALELVTADGSVVSLSRERDSDRFRGAVVGLGALGVVTQLTLDLVPAFHVRQVVYETLPFSRLETHFDAIMSSAYSISLFTDWTREQVDQVWVKRRVAGEALDGDAPSGTAARPVDLSEESDFFGARPAPVKRHPIAILPAENCTEQLGLPGPWHDRLPHFRMEHTPSSGAELQSEYILPRRHAIEAFRAVAGLRDQLAALLQISEVRTIAADDLWLSPYCGHDCVAFHFTWLPDTNGVAALLPLLEERLEPFEARPHWGKLFAMRPERLRALYPRLPSFRSLARDLDPGGKFRNSFLDDFIFGKESD